MHLVIGLGETGGPLYEVLCDKFGEENVSGHDPVKGVMYESEFQPPVDFMHICIPYSDRFVKIVQGCKEMFRAKHVIIHSTVPIGTTRQIKGAVHSPILGRHNRMKEDLLAYPKYVGGNDRAMDIFNEMIKIFEVISCATPEQTELMKLMCLAKYGVHLAFQAYQKDICKEYDISYESIVIWDELYNRHVGEDLQRPIFRELNLPIGGHCVIPNTKILNEQHPNPMLDEVLKRG